HLRRLRLAGDEPEGGCAHVCDRRHDVRRIRRLRRVPPLLDAGLGRSAHDGTQSRVPVRRRCTMTRMLCLAMVAILAGACADTPDATHHDAHVGDAAPRAEGLLPAREGMSIYQLDGVWRNQNGEQMALADLQG